MARYEKRVTIRSSYGKRARITYTRANGNKDVVEGVISTQAFVSKDPFAFNGPVHVMGCVETDTGKRFPILPLDGPLHCLTCDPDTCGHWSIEITE